jgi:hypothetical protein
MPPPRAVATSLTVADSRSPTFGLRDFPAVFVGLAIAKSPLKLI